MASPDNFNFPPYHPSQPPPPPPPYRPVTPPSPPHVRPPPAPIPVPPSPSADNHSTVIVIVFVSFGGLIFLAFIAAALCCFLKKKRKKRVRETDVVHVDEHFKVEEAIVPGPHGPQAVVLKIEDDLHVDEEIRKIEEFGKGLHAKPSALDVGTSASGSQHHQQPDHKL